jgi:hypothetical protein
MVKTLSTLSTLLSILWLKVLGTQASRKKANR